VAFLGGLVYGFSPYMLAQGSLHLNLCFAPLFPLMVVAIDDLMVRGRHSTRRAGLTLGGLATAQYFVSSELLADFGVLAVVAVVVLALRYRREAAARARRVAAGLGWALAPFAALAGYPLVFGIVGPEHYVQNYLSTHGDETIRNDLLSPLVPTPAELVAPARWSSLGAGLVTTGIAENGGYLGIPLVMCWVAALCWAALKRNSLALLLGLIALVAFLLSLGPSLQVHERDTGIWLPFALSAHFPLLQVAVAARYSLFVFLGVVIAVAVALDALWSSLASAAASRPAGVPAGAAPGPEDLQAPSRRPGSLGPPSAGIRRARGAVGPVLPEVLGAGALVAVVLLALLPDRPISSASVAVPSYFTGGGVRAVPSGSNVLFYPYPYEQDDFSMVWQAESGFRFDLLGGYVLTPLQLDPPAGAGQGGNDVPPTLTPPMLQILFYSANGSSTWSGSSTLEETFGSKRYRNLNPAPWATADIESDLVRYKVSTIVEDPARFPAAAAAGSPVLGEQTYGPDHFPDAVTAVFSHMFGPPVRNGPLLVWYHADTRPVAPGYN
jgi:hypothetical protein